MSLSDRRVAKVLCGVMGGERDGCVVVERGCAVCGHRQRNGRCPTLSHLFDSLVFHIFFAIGTALSKIPSVISSMLSVGELVP
jgi:hypothetical protein